MKKLFTFFTILVFINFYGQNFNEYTKKWVTYFGGEGTRLLNCVLDSEGNIIISGSIYGQTNNAAMDQGYFNQFITTQLPQYSYPLTTDMQIRSILAKFSAEGTLLQAVYLPYEIFSLQIDTSNHLYIYGTSKYTDLGTTNIWLETPLYIDNNISYSFITKLNPNFTTNWLSYLPIHNTSFCLDTNFNIIGVGYTTISQNITTPNVHQPNFISTINSTTGMENANNYIYKLNNQGQLQWATYYGLGIGAPDIAYTNNEIVASFKQNTEDISDNYQTNFPTPDAYQHTQSTMVVSKFNATTGQRTYSTYLDGNLSVVSLLCKNDNIYVIGNIFNPLQDTNLLTNAIQPNFGGITDVYLGKFTETMMPVWGTYIGGDFSDSFNENNKLYSSDTALYLSFYTESSNFFTSPNMIHNSNNGGLDIALMKFSENGNLIWGSYFGGSDAEVESDLSILNEDTFYLVGDTYSNQGIATAGSYQANFNKNPNVHEIFNYGNSYLAKFAPADALSVPNFTENLFQVYPNPVNGGSLTIMGNFTDTYSLQIYNVLGQVINSQKLTSGFINKIDTNALSSGTYLLNITDGSNIIYKTKILIN